jgi:hypothetical protein
MDATSGQGLKAAVAALEALAQGHAPDQAAVLAGALALESLCVVGGAARETLDAAAGLKVLTSGGTLELGDAGPGAGRKPCSPPARAPEDDHA